MADYKSKIKGLDKLFKKLNNFKKESVIKKSMDEYLLLSERFSKSERLSGPRPEFLGVRTGRLRSSIRFSKTRKISTVFGNRYVGKLGTNVEYASIHEFGGRTGRGRSFIMPARPFLQPAIEENRKKLFDILSRAINKELER